MRLEHKFILVDDVNIHYVESDAQSSALLAFYGANKTKHLLMKISTTLNNMCPTALLNVFQILVIGYNMKDPMR